MFIKRSVTRKKLRELEDLDLIKKFQDQGDSESMGILFERYTHLVYGVCRKYLSDEDESKDAVMQIFEKLLEKIHEHEVRYFSSWLYVLSRNHCLMRLRSQKSEAEAKNIYMQFMDFDYLLHHDNGQEHELEWEKLAKGIEHLSPEQRRCITLFYLESKCYQDIVNITGYDQKKVKSYIQNGKRNLKMYLEKSNEDSFEK